MKFIFNVLILILLLTPAAYAIVPPGDHDEMLDRWETRKEETFFVTTDAPFNWSKLRVRAYLQDKPAPYVILLHGSISFKINGKQNWGWGNEPEPAIQLYGMGFNVFELTRRGYNGSEGEQAEIELHKHPMADDAYLSALIKAGNGDLRPVYKLIGTLPDVQPEGILFGHSFGGLLALNASRQPEAKDIRAVIDVAGGFSTIGNKPAGEATGLETNTAKQLANTGKPALFVYSEKDSLVPISYGRELYAAQPANTGKQMITPVTLEGRDPHTALIGNYNIDMWNQALYQFLAPYFNKS